MVRRVIVQTVVWYGLMGLLANAIISTSDDLPLSEPNC
jgi:hypothetical protein